MRRNVTYRSFANGLSADIPSLGFPIARIGHGKGSAGALSCCPLCALSSGAGGIWNQGATMGQHNPSPRALLHLTKLGAVIETVEIRSGSLALVSCLELAECNGQDDQPSPKAALICSSASVEFVPVETIFGAAGTLYNYI